MSTARLPAPRSVLARPDGRSPSTTVTDMLRSLAAGADPQRSSAFERLLVRPNTVQVAIHDSLLSCVGIARGRMLISEPSLALGRLEDPAGHTPQ
jgi:hypothetical protein